MMHSSSRTRRFGGRASAGAAAVALVIGAVGFGSPSAGAANPNDFELLALATGIDTQIRDNSLPVTQVVEFASFGSAAMLSSSGVVKSNAGAPYAPFGFSLPSTVTGVGAGLVPPIPPFPGFVSATFPVKTSDTQKTGGYALSATTSAESSRGQVDLGSQPAGSPTSNGFAVAETLANDDGTVTAAGSAGLSAFSFGGVFDLGRVESTLSMRVPESGKPVITGKTDLGTITFASTFTSGLQDDNAFVAGVPIPLSPDSFGPLNAALKPYGIELTYLPRTYGYTDDTGSSGQRPNPKKTVKSVVSGGLLITSSQDIPTQGQVDGRYTIGRVELSATNNPVGGSTGAGLVGEPGAGGEGTEATDGSSGIAGDADGGEGATVGAGAGVLPDAMAPGGLDSLGAAGVPPASAPPAVATPTVDLVPAPSDGRGGAGVGIDATAFGGQLTASGEGFYLILVLVAVGAIGAAQLVRFFAVRA